MPDVIESDILSFIYREEDGTESTTLQKMEALEGALQILQRRKMITYFHAHRFEKTHPNEEIQYHLNILKHEIEHMQSCINMITSRIDWEDNENAEPGRDLYREIEEL
ncbi:hypothetical protein H6768_01935 [Candidatus Peribacteria bacterium]|nr:hypothetical protein [Candidatus Peribacteria bacterium]